MSQARSRRGTGRFRQIFDHQTSAETKGKEGVKKKTSSGAFNVVRFHSLGGPGRHLVSKAASKLGRRNMKSS